MPSCLCSNRISAVEVKLLALGSGARMDTVVGERQEISLVFVSKSWSFVMANLSLNLKPLQFPSFPTADCLLLTTLIERLISDFSLNVLRNPYLRNEKWSEQKSNIKNVVSMKRREGNQRRGGQERMWVVTLYLITQRMWHKFALKA